MNRKANTLMLVLVAFVISCNNKTSQPGEFDSNNVFANVDYDKVVAYSYNGERGNEIINNKGTLAGEIKSKVELNESQIIKFTNLLCNKSTYDGAVASCFDPHLGIVFYKNNKPAAYVSICLDCNNLVSSIKIPNSNDGFSRDGEKNIMSFEKELGFQH